MIKLSEKEAKITKVQSFLKQCCARSSSYETKVLNLMSAEEGFVKVPGFHEMKIALTEFTSAITSESCFYKINSNSDERHSTFCQSLKHFNWSSGQM